MAMKRAMGTATRLASKKEDNIDEEGNGNSIKGGRQQRG